MATLEFLLQSLITGVLVGGLYALISLGLTILYGVARVLNIAHGDVIILGAYFGFYLFTLLGLNPLISVVLAFLVFSALGFGVHRSLFTRIMRRSDQESLVSNTLLITFALILIIEGAEALFFSTRERDYQFLVTGINLFGVYIAPNMLVSFAVSSAATLALYVVFKFTWLGRSFRSVMDDPLAAKIVGVNTDRVFLYCSVLGFALAGMAGVMASMIYATVPFVGLHYTIIAFVVVTIAGRGSIVGTWFAALILGLIQSLGVSFISSGLQDVLAYILLIVILIARPQGIFEKA